MKIIYSLFLSLLFLSCINAKEQKFMGCTPAKSEVVRAFLGIPLTDSVDFIRWIITINDDNYSLKCNYGVAKPNTNGFWNGGKWVELNGEVKKEKNYYFLEEDKKRLGLAILNENLLHLVADDKSLLVGTGGWSYTLSLEKGKAEEINFQLQSILLTDSMAFHGRTPCVEFGDAKKNCQRLKWAFTLFAKAGKPATYSLRGTAYEYTTRTGSWEMHANKNGNAVYQLNDEPRPLYFILLDENNLALTDKDGNLLVGNEDFSYTLSRKQ